MTQAACPTSPASEVDELALVESLEDGSLPPGEFDHRAHLRYSWILLKRSSLGEVLPRISDALRRFAIRHGAPDKFHTTVTWTYVLVMHQLMQPAGTATGSPPDLCFERFLEENPLLLEPVPRFMSRFYDASSWQAPLAARVYVLPDRVRDQIPA